MDEAIIPREKYPCSILGHSGINSNCFQILKADKEDINHEEEKTDYLNEYRLNEQTLILVKETKEEAFPVQTKTKSQNSTA